MYRLRNLSRGEKFTAIVMITCSAAVLAACTALVVYDLTTFRRSLVNELVTVAKITGSNLTAALTSGDARAANEVLEPLGNQRHIVEACVYKIDGTPLAQYSRDDSKNVFAPPAPLPDHAVIVSGSVLVFHQVRFEQEVIGSIYLKSDLDELQARRERLSTILLAAFLLSLAISFFVAAPLQRFIAEPFRQLARTAYEVSAQQDYSLRITKTKNDEVGFLVDTFNAMLAQRQQREIALLHLRESVEFRVDERTLELQTDIAERTGTERGLEERKRFLNTLIENIPLAIVVVNHEGDVQMCNPAFETLFRYSQKEILGRQMVDLVTSPETRTELLDNKMNLLTGLAIHCVTQRSRSDGSIVDVEVQSVPLKIKGKRTGALLLYQDITERKLAEEAMRHAMEAAEAASRAKSEFLANMSHEIRTPMNGILGMTELTLDTQLDSDQREYLGMVKTSADALLVLLNDILDFSKIEAGKLDLDVTEFSLRESMGETIKILGLRAQQKSLELGWRAAEDVPEYLAGDLGRLRQVLVNLIGNALKFTARGEIFVLVEKLRDLPEEVELHFSVRDTGIGIVKDKQSEIFAPFTQADGSTTRLYGGTGLGLGIAARLVEMMGGTIWVESEAGCGSTFHFTARFVIAENQNQAEHASGIDLQQPVGEQKLPLHVLLAEDHPINRLLARRLLEKFGHTVTVAENGQEALAAIEHERPDLVLMDVQMPLMDGLEAMRAVRRNEQATGRHLPIIALTAHAMKGDRERCLDAGADEYLTKPIRESELFAALGRMSAAPNGSDSSLAPAVESPQECSERTRAPVTKTQRFR
jgi:PAS domain S-box-containing protein